MPQNLNVLFPPPADNDPIWEEIVLDGVIPMNMDQPGQITLHDADGPFFAIKFCFKKYSAHKQFYMCMHLTHQLNQAPIIPQWLHKV